VENVRDGIGWVELPVVLMKCSGARLLASASGTRLGL
jgi:hypothetical protein